MKLRHSYGYEVDKTLDVPESIVDLNHAVHNAMQFMTRHVKDYESYPVDHIGVSRQQLRHLSELLQDIEAEIIKSEHRPTDV